MASTDCKSRFLLPFGKTGPNPLPLPPDREFPASYFPFGHAHLKKGGSVLVLGCGSGGDAFAAARRLGRNGAVYALERSQEVLRLAESTREKLSAENVRFIHSPPENIPLPDASVDAVIADFLLHPPKDRARALREAWRVLKNGGRMALMDIAVLKKPKAIYIAHNDPAAAFLKQAAGMGRYIRALKAAGFAHARLRPCCSEALQVLLAEHAKICKRKLRFLLWPSAIIAEKPPI